MKIVTDRTALLDATAAASAVVRYSKVKPVLNCLRLTARDAALTVEATDLDVGIRLGVPCEVRRAGVSVIPAASLGEWLKASPPGEVEVAHAPGDKTAALRAVRGKCELPTFPPADFPDPIPHLAEVASAVADRDALVAAVARVRAATDGTFTPRFGAMTGVLFDLAGETLSLVATDTKELSAAEVPASDVAGKGSFAVLPENLKALRGLAAGPVRVRFSAGTAAFAAGGDELCVRLLEGRFPPWRDALRHSRKNAPHAIDIPFAAFAAAVRQVCVTDGKETLRLTCEIRPGEITLRTTDPETGARGEAVVEVADYAGPETTVAVDSARFRAFLAAAEAGKPPSLPVRFADGTKPLIADPAAGWAYLLMPLAG